MTLVVLGLDAVDAANVERWGIDEFQLESYGEMESVAHQKEWPHTGEVWPTIATGLHPREHGITMGGESQWSNPVVEVASHVAGRFMKMGTRAKIGRAITATIGAEWTLDEVDEPTFLDGEAREVHNWPGVHNSHEVTDVWKTFKHADDLSQEQYDRRLLAVMAAKLGWVREMLDHELVLAATQVHALDMFGHTYARDEDHLRVLYERAATYVGEIRDAMDPDDELLLLSDHGMRTTWIDGDDHPDLENHSWRAFSASTTGDRPESVFDVKEWVERNVGSHERAYEEHKTETDLDMPEDTLRELGYIE